MMKSISKKKKRKKSKQILEIIKKVYNEGNKTYIPKIQKI